MKDGYSDLFRSATGVHEIVPNGSFTICLWPYHHIVIACVGQAPKLYKGQLMPMLRKRLLESSLVWIAMVV